MTTEYDFEGVRQRLASELKRKNTTMRAASQKANLGRGYVHSVITNGQEPTVARLASLCEANDISLAYVLFGVNLTPEIKNLLDLMQKNPETREGILTLMKSFPVE